ncbi:MAG: carboxypeptidase regulatory-like domain-containing protein [Deltaproteobacteria bacterium]|nr:carboxypeptidase regulatory-like domain-containing protein [Deltaproteobacteria bacterium]
MKHAMIAWRHGSFALLTVTLVTVACGDDPLGQLEELCPDGTTPVSAGCPLGSGIITGRVCDTDAGVWRTDITASVVAGQDLISDPADVNGRFTLEPVPQGNYRVRLEGPTYSSELNATVFKGEVTEVGHTVCNGVDPIENGSIEGRICGGDGYWLSGARVFVDLGSSVVETFTDSDGHYLLNGLPAGNHLVQVERGSWSTSFGATVTANQTTVLPDPVCIPPTTYIAVVTGVYDSVEVVLANLGFPTRDTYNSRTPSTADPNGNVDIINGESTFWIDEFLQDPVWMAEYDIIFFNCGVNDDPILFSDTSVGPAVSNLQAFVNAGGSVYSSDWAAEIVRIAFPGRINFLGSDSTFGDSRRGLSDSSLPAQVTDAGLAQALGRTNLTINLNLDIWSVMDRLNTQPASLTVLVKGNPTACDDTFFCLTTSPVTDAPLVVHFDHGAGRVLFTSAHNEAQTTADLRDVLYYAIFEL